MYGRQKSKGKQEAETVKRRKNYRVARGVPPFNRQIPLVLALPGHLE
jgi:hypothetical protein